ncbi:MAG TPA: LacI family DNA-binding transcriptional regulator [Gaiellales bacterium]|jgi:LacI family transcriptional regulator
MAGTIRDVAREAGVSQATAARALAGYGYVSDTTLRRVRQAATSIGYRPNALARSLVSGATKTIGVVLGDIENPFFAAAARGLADVLERDGYTLLLANSDEDLARERRAVEALYAHQVDGLAVVPSSGDDGAHLAAILREGRPVVLLDRSIAGLDADAVLVDNRSGAERAVRHLLELGHRRIGLVGDSPGISSTAERIDGYRAALAAAGIPADDALVSLGGSTIEQGRRSALQLLERPDRPTALFTVNNFMTAGAMMAVRELALRMPDELALVGFDDLDWTTLVEPPITVVAQPVAELGRTVAELLLERIAGDQSPPREIRLRTRLVVRGSCGGGAR